MARDVSRLEPFLLPPLLLLLPPPMLLLLLLVPVLVLLVLLPLLLLMLDWWCVVVQHGCPELKRNHPMSHLRVRGGDDVIIINLSVIY